MICAVPEDENTLLVDIFLDNLVGWMAERWRAQLGREVLQRPDELSAFVRQSAPHGTILFANAPLLRQMKREVDQDVLAK